MSISFSCEAGDHAKCIRPSCECFCDHPHRAELATRADELLARRAPDARSARLPRPETVNRSATQPQARKQARGATERRPRVPRDPDAPRARRSDAGRSRPCMISIDVDELAARYQSGIGVDELAESYRCSHDTIRARLKSAGVELRRGGAHRTIPLPLDELVEAYEAGDTAYVLADRFDTSPGTIIRRLRDAGVTIRARGDRSIRLPDAEMADQYAAGVSLEELGDKHDVSASTIANHLKAIGVTLRPQGGKITVDVDELWRLYETGLSTEDLAHRFGISPQTIKRRLVDAGHELRHQGAKPNGMPRRVELPIREIVLRYRFGWSLQDLGDEYGCAWNTIRARLVEAGERIRPSGRQPQRRTA